MDEKRKLIDEAVKKDNYIQRYNEMVPEDAHKYLDENSFNALKENEKRESGLSIKNDTEANYFLLEEQKMF